MPAGAHATAASAISSLALLCIVAQESADRPRPRILVSYWLKARFGGLVAYSYLPRRLYPTEEVLGRDLGKEIHGRTTSRDSVYGRSPLWATRVIPPPNL